MLSVKTQVKAESIAIALSQIVGSKPIITYYSDHAEINFTPEQRIKLRSYLDMKLKSTGEDNDLKINFEPVLIPILFKKVAPYIIGLIAIGYITGKTSKKR